MNIIMRKTIILNRTLFVAVTLVLVTMINSAAQQSQSESQTLQERSPQWLLQRIKAGVTAPPPDPNVPGVRLLSEPQSTISDSNHVFIDKLSDPVEYAGNAIPLEQCRLEIHASTNQIFTELIRLRVIRGNAQSVRFDSLELAKDIYYRARLWVPKDTTLVPGDWPGADNTKFVADSMAVSTQDANPPQADSLQLIPHNPSHWRNGWLNTIGAVDVGFYGLQDPAGLYRAFLHDNERTIRQDTTFIPDPDGSPGSSPIDSVFLTLKKTAVAEGENPLYAGACDAAYTPESHGPGTNIDSLWTINGNCSFFLDSVIVKVDTTDPVLSFDGVKDVYSSDDREEGVFNIHFTIIDNLSGVDVDSIRAEIDAPLEIVELAINDDDNETTTGHIKINSVAQDTTATLTLDAMDIAGNTSSINQELVFRVEPPILTDFRVTDLDFGNAGCLVPAFGYTDSTTVSIDSLHSPEPGKIDSLRLTVLNKPVSNDTIVHFDGGSVEQELLEIIREINSGDKLAISIAAIDRFGNEQTVNIPEHSIVFDDQIADIQISVQDTTTWSEEFETFPAELGAFPGWTNDTHVLVTVDTMQAVPDFYRMKEIDPNDSCYVSPVFSFIYQLSESEQLWPFTFQIGDSAGNESNETFEDIRLDRTIFTPVAEDFKVFDLETGSDEFTASDSAGVLFLQWEEVTDLSRIIVNNAIYYPTNQSDTLVVPTGDGTFDLALADSAGNISAQISDSIRVIPVFTFNLSDTSVVNPAQPGYTNDMTVEWSFSERNFDSGDIQKITFYNENLTDSVMWQPEDDKLLSLASLYGRTMKPGNYLVKGSALLRNGVSTPDSEIASASIIFDHVMPETNSIVLEDINDFPYQAELGFTDSLVVKLLVAASPDVDSIAKSGDVEYHYSGKTKQPVPATLAYSDSQLIELTDNGNLDEKTVTVAVRDSAGNWSDPTESSITFLKQNITAEIDTLETITLPQTALQENALFYVPVLVSSDHPGYLSKALAFPVMDSADTLATTINLEECQSVGDRYRCYVPFKVLERGEQTVIMTDSAGNGSNADNIFFDLQLEPEITTTVYDYSEVPDFHSPTDELPADFMRSDSLFTDGSQDSIVVLTRLVNGNWDSIRVVSDFSQDSHNVLFKPVANPDSPIDLRTVPFSGAADSLVQVSFSVHVKNIAGLKDSASYVIIYDTMAPELTSFPKSASPADSVYSFDYTGKDKEPGALAGIIIREALLENCMNGCDTSYTFIPVGQENKITLFPRRGVRELCAFLVDKADVDQNRPEKIKDFLRRRDFSFIDHPSNMECYQIRLNPKELSNYPNPFNPKIESTKLLFYLNEDSRVKISILDAFGNLVKSQYADGQKGQNDGHFNEQLTWDGRNGKDEYVANGGYICVIQALDSGEKFIRKIAVMK